MSQRGSQGEEAWGWAKITDNTLLVIKSGYTKKDKIETVVRQLQENHVNILGVVLNDAPASVAQEFQYC